MQWPKSEDTKAATISCNSRDRQLNDQTKKDKMRNFHTNTLNRKQKIEKHESH